MNYKALYREHYTDFEWFEIMKRCGESLPIEYCDMFDRYDEISEDYEDIFTVDLYILTDKKTAQLGAN